jgi:hypothetical protein
MQHYAKVSNIVTHSKMTLNRMLLHTKSNILLSVIVSESWRKPGWLFMLDLAGMPARDKNVSLSYQKITMGKSLITPSTEEHEDSRPPCSPLHRLRSLCYPPLLWTERRLRRQPCQGLLPVSPVR